MFSPNQFREAAIFALIQVSISDETQPASRAPSLIGAGNSPALIAAYKELLFFPVISITCFSRKIFTMIAPLRDRLVRGNKKSPAVANIDHQRGLSSVAGLNRSCEELNSWHERALIF